MLSIVLFSASVAFAADDGNITASQVNDEISTDNEVLTIDEGSCELESDNGGILQDNGSISDSNVVTNDTFYNYFDEDGVLTSNATELIFEGDFSNIGVYCITIAKSVTFTGRNATFNNIAFIIKENNVVIDGFNLNMNRDMYLVNVKNVDDVTISNNVINFLSLKSMDSFAILAKNITTLNLLKNTITYVGTTEGANINNAVRVEGGRNVTMSDNVYNIIMPSVDVKYDLNYNLEAFSEGIVFLTCENVTLTRNNIKLNYSGISGSSDTIYVVTIGNANMNYTDFTFPNVCKNVVVSDNNITANGHGYIYSMSIVADEFELTNNNFDITAEANYANAIAVGGPSSNGKVSGNVIEITAPNVVYGIYAYQLMGPIENVTYSDNIITGNAYAACGFEIVMKNPVISDNKITLNGNHTVAIVANSLDEGTISGNQINSLGSNIGNQSTGDSMIHMESAGISVKGDWDISDNSINSTSIGVNLILGGDIDLEDNVINVIAKGETDNYAVYAKGMDELTMSGNIVNFVGNVNENITSNGIYVFSSNGVHIFDNELNLNLVSAFVPWIEEPPGSWNYVRHAKSSGIVVVNSEDVIFDSNNVTTTFVDVVGNSDTIYVLDFTDTGNAIIKNNNINSLGNTYIYGIIIEADNFTISFNNITSSANYYADGIDIEGGYGNVESNVITVNANNSTYGIYSGMGGKSVSVNITHNKIHGNAYYVVGIEVGGDEALIDNNIIYVTGNHTIGIGSKVDEINITNNNITSEASNEGNLSIWDSMGTDTVGVKIAAGNVTIANNTIQTSGDYAVNLNGNNATISNNYLTGKKGVGSNSVANAGPSTVITDSSPKYKVIISVMDYNTVYNSGLIYYAILSDENGDPIKNATVFLSAGLNKINTTTDNSGVAAFEVSAWDVGKYNVYVTYFGNETYGPKSVKGHINIEKRLSEIAGVSSKTVLLTAIKSGSYYDITLKDDMGNPLANKEVTITFNGKTHTGITNSAGVVKFRLAATKTGTQKLVVKFNSDSNYVASTLTATVKITKEATKLTANKKAFKAKKTKKYNIVLKDSKKKGINKVKVTLKIKDKIYNAKTNSKGNAVFKIKLTKKGTYAAKVKFAGNSYYKAASKKVKITIK